MEINDFCISLKGALNLNDWMTFKLKLYPFQHRSLSAKISRPWPMADVSLNEPITEGRAIRQPKLHINYIFLMSFSSKVINLNITGGVG